MHSLKTLKMNFKAFTSALLATGATAAYSEEDQGLPKAVSNTLHAEFNAMPKHVHRRFWVRILLSDDPTVISDG